jgi:co-chaperonin GroES (HSP10)
MNTIYEPIGNTILVEPVLSTISHTIPGGFEFEATNHKIIALGTGPAIPAMLSVGDIVVLSGGNMVRIKDSKYQLVTSDTVLARVKVK